MAAKRLNVELSEFKDGKVVYLTKNFSTYNVKYVRMEDGMVVVEVVQHLLTHRRSMQQFGIKKALVFPEGTKFKIAPNKLWKIDNSTMWDKIKRWFNRKH